MVKPSKYQLGLLVDPTTCMVLYISGGAGFLSSIPCHWRKNKSVLASHHFTSEVVVAIEMPFHFQHSKSEAYDTSNFGRLEVSRALTTEENQPAKPKCAASALFTAS